MKKIALICPEKAEFDRAIEILNLDVEQIDKRKHGKGEIGDYSLHAICSGPGKVHAASATQQLINQINPELIIDTGIASSLIEDIRTFSIISGVNIYEFDLYSTDEIEKIPAEIASTTLLEDEKMRDKLSEQIQKMNEEIFIADLLSGEKKVDNRIFRDLLHMKFNGEGVSRETSAVTKTAELNEVNSLSFRIVTDYGDKNYMEDREKNKDKALTILYSSLKSILEGGIL